MLTVRSCVPHSIELQGSHKHSQKGHFLSVTLVLGPGRPETHEPTFRSQGLMGNSTSQNPLNNTTESTNIDLPVLKHIGAGGHPSMGAHVTPISPRPRIHPILFLS